VTKVGLPDEAAAHLYRLKQAEALIRDVGLELADQASATEATEASEAEEGLHRLAVEHGDGFERIVVECEDMGTGRRYLEAFMGRWLVEPVPALTQAIDSDITEFDWGRDAYFGVALTRKGRIAVYYANCQDGKGGTQSGLVVFDTLDDLEPHDCPASIVAEAHSALTGEPMIIERDI
jgi:hypothetical protein